MPDAKYLHIALARDTGKTKVWTVMNITNRAPLGEITWYSQWRRYVFVPLKGTLYDSNCLKEITTHIDQSMEARKK